MPKGSRKNACLCTSAHWWSHTTPQPISSHSTWHLQWNEKPKCQGTERNPLPKCEKEVFQLHQVCGRRTAMAAYIKESPCMFQDELAGVRLVFAVGDIHLKFICLWKQTSREKQDKLFLCSHRFLLRHTRINTGDNSLPHTHHHPPALTPCHQETQEL